MMAKIYIIYIHKNNFMSCCYPAHSAEKNKFLPSFSAFCKCFCSGIKITQSRDFKIQAIDCSVFFGTCSYRRNDNDDDIDKSERSYLLFIIINIFYTWNDTFTTIHKTPRHDIDRIFE